MITRMCSQGRRTCLGASSGSSDEATGSPDSSDSRDLDEAAVTAWISKRVLSRIAEERGLDPADLGQIARLSMAKLDGVLDQLLAEMQPPNIDPNLWFEWFEGSLAPSRRKDLPNPVSGERHSVAEIAKRRSEKHQQLEQRVADMRAELATAEAELDESRLVEAELATWAVMSNLTKIFKPMFAMGPALTVMRAISAHSGGAERSDEREEETNALLKMLDHNRGNLEFEADLRAALLGLCEVYPVGGSSKPVRAPAISDTTAEKAAVLDGFAPVDRPIARPRNSLAGRLGPEDPGDASVM